MDLRLIYITAGDMEEAQRIGHSLVSDRLAACVNIVDNMRSMYWWEGRIQHDREVIIIAKTQASRVPSLIERVTSLHRDECPCVVSLPLKEGYRPFLQWIESETQADST